jgi:hypothetical protein
MRSAAKPRISNHQAGNASFETRAKSALLQRRER